MGIAFDDLDLDIGALEIALDQDPAGDDALAAAGLTDEDGTIAIDEAAPIPGGGPILEEEDPAKVFKMIDEEVRSQEPLAKNRAEKDKHYDRVRRNVGFTYLEKSEDQSVVKATLAPGVEDRGQAVPNKVDDVCTKIVNQVLVDQFLPNPKPDGDTDRNRGAADLTKKFLRSDGGPAGTNDAAMLRWALNTNITQSAAFAYCWIDKTAGGWRPKQVKAHPQATDPKNPLVAPKLDPRTGQPLPGPDGQPVLERSTDPILRYVAEVEDPAAVPDQFTGKRAPKLVFTENASEAVRQFLPKHRRRNLTRSQVRTVPRSASVFHADAVIVLMWETVREAKRRFPALNDLSKSQIKELCSWKPKRWKSIVPESQRPKGDDESGSDNSLLFWYMQFCRIADDYPDGAEVHVNGASVTGAAPGGFVFKRDTLREDVELEDGTSVPVLMEPPVTEFVGRQAQADDGDPQGEPFVAAFEGAAELVTRLYLSVIDCIDKGLNPNIYLASTSTLTREDINRRDGTPLEILTPEDKPEYEKTPELPIFTPQVLEKAEDAMFSAAQTNETGRGLDSRYAVSGKAKEVSLATAKTMLSGYWQGTVDGLVYWWRIKTQLAQARLTVPQQVKLSGEDSAYKQRWFVGSDMVGVSDIALAPGSGTMMSGSEKVNWLLTLAGGNAAKIAFLPPEQAAELARAAMADDLGLPPNVHEEHINRQIADWIEGPPTGWEEEFQRQQEAKMQHEAATQEMVAVLVQQGVDEPTARQQAAQQVPPPQLTPLFTPFEPRPNDEEPAIAKIRASKLSRLMATIDYTKHSKAWRTLVDGAYGVAAPAAGIVTVKQQQEAQQQQAKAQADAAARAEQTKQQTAAVQLQDKREQRQFAAVEGDKERQAEAIHDDKVIAADLQKEEIRTIARGVPRATPGAPSAPSALET